MAMGFIGFISYLGAATQEKLSGVFLKAHTIVGPDGAKHIDDWSGPIALWVGGSIVSLVLAATLWKVRHREEGQRFRPSRPTQLPRRYRFRVAVNASRLIVASSVSIDLPDPLKYTGAPKFSR
jgi:hypothetical protein